MTGAKVNAAHPVATATATVSAAPTIFGFDYRPILRHSCSAPQRSAAQGIYPNRRLHHALILRELRAEFRALSLLV